MRPQQTTASKPSKPVNPQHQPTVGDLMSFDLFTLMEDDNINILDELMKWKRIRHVPVVNLANELTGLVTHRDFLQATVSNLAEIDVKTKTAIYKDVPVKAIMREVVATATPDMSLAEAAKVMNVGKIGCLPVLEGKKLVGIITEADFVKSFFQWEVSFLTN